MTAGSIVVGILVLFILYSLVRFVRIIPQGNAGIVERLGRFHKVLEPGINFVVPFVDKLRPLIDLREQVVTFPPSSVITEDNVTVNIDIVLYFTITDPRASTYEIANPLQAVENLALTTLRSVVGSMALDQCLSGREIINAQLRTVLDEKTGAWGIRVGAAEIRELLPASESVKSSMESQSRAERVRRAQMLEAEGTKQAAILTAEGEQRSSILRAEGAKQSSILNAEANKQSAILSAEGDREAAAVRAEGEAKAIHAIADALAGQPAEAVLAYRYIDVLPEMAKGEGNAVFVVPSELTKALDGVSKHLGFGDDHIERQNRAERPAPPRLS